MADKKIFIGEDFVRKQWFNLNADFPSPVPPPINPKTKEPIGPEALKPIFPMNLIKHEVIPNRWVDIPEEVPGVYKQWRPTPLYRADVLEKVLDYPGKIYFKNEGVSPPGHHKPNTAVAQAYYNKALASRNSQLKPVQTSGDPLWPLQHNFSGWN